MKETRISFPSGKLSLEGVLSVPDGSEPFRTVIVCHPHPLYGGSMDNNVVSSLCDALAQEGFISLKFNFRGVGGSEGYSTAGSEESEDVRAAVSYIVTVKGVDPAGIGLAGYSAGIAFALPVAVKDERVKALAAISPPLAMFDFGVLKGCRKPKLLISGSRDSFIPSRQFLEFCQGLPEPGECETVSGADHFWWGYEPLLSAKVASFFSRVL